MGQLVRERVTKQMDNASLERLVQLFLTHHCCLVLSRLSLGSGIFEIQFKNAPFHRLEIGFLVSGMFSILGETSVRDFWLTWLFPWGFKADCSLCTRYP